MNPTSAKTDDLWLVIDAALDLIQTLGGPDGYFPTAGATKTHALRDALVNMGFEIDYHGGRVKAD